MLSERLKVSIVKDNIHLQFQKNFQVMFIDPEFGFRADDKLISMIISSLELETSEKNLI